MPFTQDSVAAIENALKGAAGIAAFTDWCEDLRKELSVKPLQTGMNTVLAEFRKLCNLVQGGPEIYNDLTQHLVPYNGGFVNTGRKRVAGITLNQMAIEDSPLKVDIILRAFNLLLDAKPLADGVKTLREQSEEHWKAAAQTTGDMTDDKAPWSGLVNATPRDMKSYFTKPNLQDQVLDMFEEGEEKQRTTPANSVLSQVEQEEETPISKERTESMDGNISGRMQNEPRQNGPMTFTLNNPEKPKRRESESTVGSDEEETPEEIDSTETLEFCRYLKVAASVSNKAGNKTKPNDVADALKKLFEKLISNPERTNQKQVKAKNEGLLDEQRERMNLVGDRDRKEMLEVLGLIDTDGKPAEVRIEEDPVNKTFTIKFYMDNQEITNAGSVVLDSHDDGSWKNIRFNAVDADHGVQLMSDFARKTSQIAQRNDDKPVLKKEVGGDNPEAVIENMFRAIHNKMYPIIDESQLAAINKLKEKLEARKDTPSAGESDGYILKQIETITEWMKLASEPELNDSVEAGINPYRIAKAMNYLADVHSKLTELLDDSEYSDKPAMQGWIKMIQAVSGQVIANKATQNTKEKTVSTGVDNVDISDNKSETSTRSRRSSGTSLDEEPIIPPEKPKPKTTRKLGNSGVRGRFGRM